MQTDSIYGRKVALMQRLCGLQRIRGDEVCHDVYRAAQRISPNRELRHALMARLAEARNAPAEDADLEA